MIWFTFCWWNPVKSCNSWDTPNICCFPLVDGGLPLPGDSGGRLSSLETHSAETSVATLKVYYIVYTDIWKYLYLTLSLSLFIYIYTRVCLQIYVNIFTYYFISSPPDTYHAEHVVWGWAMQRSKLNLGISGLNHHVHIKILSEVVTWKKQIKRVLVWRYPRLTRDPSIFSFDPLLISTLLRMPKRSHTQPLQSKEFSVTNWLGSGHCYILAVWLSINMTCCILWGP